MEGNRGDAEEAGTPGSASGLRDQDARRDAPFHSRASPEPGGTGPASRIPRAAHPPGSVTHTTFTAAWSITPRETEPCQKRERSVRRFAPTTTRSARAVSAIDTR